MKVRRAMQSTDVVLGDVYWNCLLSGSKPYATGWVAVREQAAKSGTFNNHDMGANCHVQQPDIQLDSAALFCSTAYFSRSL